MFWPTMLSNVDVLWRLHLCSVTCTIVTTVAKLEDAQAANCYEQLTLQQPEEEDYKVYYAQSLYAASLYQEAMKVTVTVEGPDHQAAMLKLQAAIKWVQQKKA